MSTVIWRERPVKSDFSSVFQGMKDAGKKKIPPAPVREEYTWETIWREITKPMPQLLKADIENDVRDMEGDFHYNCFQRYYTKVTLKLEGLREEIRSAEKVIRLLNRIKKDMK